MKDKRSLFILSLILWVVSNVALSFVFYHSSFIFLETRLFLIIPYLPLVGILYFGHRQKKLFFLIIILFFVSNVLLIVDAVYLWLDLTRNLAPLAAFIASFVYLQAIQLLFIGIFFVLNQYKKEIHVTKKILVTILILVILIYARSIYHEVGDDSQYKKRCMSESTDELGIYGTIFLLEPMTKSEVVKTVKENDFKISHMTLARKENLESAYLLQLTDQVLDSSTINESLVNYPYYYEYSFDKDLIKAYELDEPVVWAMRLTETPINKIIPFVYELDVNQGRIGISQKGKGLWEMKPEYFREQTKMEKVPEAACYKYLEDK